MPRRRRTRRAFLLKHDPRPESSVPWPRARWEYSLLLPIALVLVLATVFLAPPRQELLRIQVISAASGDAMPGAVVRVGDDTYRTDDGGEVRVVRPGGDVEISAEAGGFTEVDLPGQDAEDVRLIQLQPAMVNGVVKDAETGEPVAGAEMALQVGEEEAVSTSRSGSGGTYIFKNVPADAVIRVEAAGYEPVMEPVESRSQLDIELVPLEAGG